MSLYGCLHIRSSSRETGYLDEDGNPFSPFGPGRSLMNQFLPVDQQITTDTYGGGGVLVTPSEYDVMEFNRVWRPELRR